MTEVRTTSATGGQKGVKDERYDLVPVDPMAMLARLYSFGAGKYQDHNWRKGYEWSKSYAAAMRHMTQFWNGEDIDEESGLPHVISAVFHMFTLAQFMKDFPEFDDRYKVGTAKVEEDRPGAIVIDEYPGWSIPPKYDWPKMIDVADWGRISAPREPSVFNFNQVFQDFWDQPESDDYTFEDDEPINGWPTEDVPVDGTWIVNGEKVVYRDSIAVPPSRPWQVGDTVDLIPVTLDGPAGTKSFTLVIRNGN